MNDLKFAFRQLLKNPGFTAGAVLTLALGIGANTAIFSAVNAVMLRPLPFPEPEQLVGVWEEPSKGSRKSVSPGVFKDWKNQSRSFEALSVVSPAELNLTGDGQPERISALQVSANYLDVFRIGPVLGRGFLPTDDQPGQNNKVVILTHGLWQRRFGGNPGVIGRQIHLNLESHTIVGVLPTKPALNPGVELLVPFVLTSEPWHQTRENHLFFAVGRLKPGIAVDQAQSELTTIKQRLNPEYPAFKREWGYLLVPLHDQIVGNTRKTLWVLLGAVGCVLLIACANVANLLLARAAARQKEMAVRSALGASRWRVIRQLIAESVLLSTCGGGLGLALATWAMELFTRLSAATLPRSQEIGLDWRVLSFAVLVSIVTGLIFGLAPALHAARCDVNAGLKEAGRSTMASRSRLRSSLIVSEIALSLVLLAGAGLLLRSLFHLLNVPTGFDSRNALVMDVSLPKEKYPRGDDGARFFHEAVARLEGLPGVEAAGMATTLPLTGPNYGTSITVEGIDQPQSPEQGIHTRWDFVAGHYFRAMGIPIIRGRALTERDNSTNAPRVAVINEALARKAFGEHEPLGKRIRFWGQPWEVVGIVGSVRQTGLADPAAERIYLPQAFCFWNGGSLAVRTKVEPASLAQAIRAEILALDSEQPVANIRTLEQVTTDSTAARRLTLLLLGFLASAALLLAALGLYGVMAYTVTQRTSEIGLRMALGARRSDVFKLVVRHGLALTLLGIGLGVAGGLGLTRVIATQLYGVEASDPLTFASISVLILLTALVACGLPARRATKIDPMEALRCE